MSADAATILGQVAKAINDAAHDAWEAEPVHNAASLVKRVSMLAEDRKAWLANAKTAEKENQRLQGLLPARPQFKSSVMPRTRCLRA